MQYTVEQIKAYLDTLRKIEADIYTHKCVIDRVEQQIAQAKQRYQNNRYKPLIKIHPTERPYSKEQLVGRSLLSGCLGAMVGFFASGIAMAIPMFFIESTGGIIACLIIILACSIIFAVKFYQDDYKIDKERANVYQAHTAANERITKENEASRQNDKWRISLLQQLSTKLGANCYQLEQVRNRLYQKNIIYPDYRGLISVCQLYQYFDSGRCDSLEGPFGAYNLYEADRKHNEVLTKLDEISRKLDIIRNNQQVLYATIQQCNNQIRTLQSGIDNINQNLQDINQNQQMIAYSTEHIRKLQMYEFMIGKY